MNDTNAPAVFGKLDLVNKAEMRDLLREILLELESEGYLIKHASEFASKEAINVAIGKIEQKTGQPSDEALLFALTLYEVAIDATLQGQRLVLVDQNYGFVREVTGLLPKPIETPSREKVAG